MLRREMEQGLIGKVTESSDVEILPDSVKIYLHEISGIPLLSAKDEKLLGSQIRYGSKDKAQEAKGRLIGANLRLVVSIAKNYVDQGLSLTDLIQEGNKGLLRTANRFDYRKGYRFSSYASWWIHEQTTRAIARQTRTICITALVLEAVNRLFHTGHGLAEKFEMQAPPEDMGQLAEEIKQDTSPDMTVSEEGYSYLSGVSYYTDPKRGHLEVTRVGQDRVQRGST